MTLAWTQDEGWAVMLRPPGRGDPALPWRFLHMALVPDPAQVATIATGLLRGADPGMPYPAQFHLNGYHLPTVVGQLAAHTSDDTSEFEELR